MSKESYARGFCKVAEAHGVDPVALAKYAAQGKPAEKKTYPTTNTNPTLLDHVSVRNEMPGSMNSPGGRAYVGRLWDSLGTVNPQLRDYFVDSESLGQIADFYRDVMSGRKSSLGIGGIRPSDPSEDEVIKALYAAHTNAYPRAVSVVNQPKK